MGGERNSELIGGATNLEAEMRKARNCCVPTEQPLTLVIKKCPQWCTCLWQRSAMAVEHPEQSKTPSFCGVSPVPSADND